jgi:hypothetical protein
VAAFGLSLAREGFQGPAATGGASTLTLIACSQIGI